MLSSSDWGRGWDHCCWWCSCECSVCLLVICGQTCVYISVCIYIHLVDSINYLQVYTLTLTTGETGWLSQREVRPWAQMQDLWAMQKDGFSSFPGSSDCVISTSLKIEYYLQFRIFFIFFSSVTHNILAWVGKSNVKVVFLFINAEII